SMEAYCPSQDCNPHESICAKPRIEFICATHCANPTCGVRAFGVGQMLCRQVVVLQWQCQVGNSRRSVGACGSRQGVLKYGFSRDTRLCSMENKRVYATPLIMRREVGERAIGAGFIILLVA